MSRRRLDALVFLVAMPALATAQRGASSATQSNPYRLMQVQSCPYADRLLGPLRDDARGAVRGYYDVERDTSYFLTGTGDAKVPEITSSMKFSGTEPVRDLAIQLTAFLRGRDAQNVAEASRYGPLHVAFVLNDSVTVYPTSTTLGHLDGDAKFITLPASALLKGEDLLKVARAQSIIMKAGLASRGLGDERRELRALIRVVVCPR